MTTPSSRLSELPERHARTPSPLPRRTRSPMPAPPPLLSRSTSPLPSVRPLSRLSDAGGSSKPVNPLRVSTKELKPTLSIDEVKAILAVNPHYERILRLLKLLHTTIVSDEAMKAKQCLFEVMQCAEYKDCYIALYLQDRRREVQHMFHRIQEQALNLSTVKQRYVQAHQTDPHSAFQKSRLKEAYKCGLEDTEQDEKTRVVDSFISASLHYACVCDDSEEKIEEMIENDQLRSICKQHLEADPKYGERFKNLTSIQDKITLLKQLLFHEIKDYEFLKAEYDQYDPITKKRSRHIIGHFARDCLKNALERGIERPLNLDQNQLLLSQFMMLYAALATLFKLPITLFAKLCDLQPDAPPSKGQLYIDCTTPRSLKDRLVYIPHVYVNCATHELSSLEIEEVLEIEWPPAEDPKAKKTFAFHVKSLIHIDVDTCAALWPAIDVYRNNCLDTCQRINRIVTDLFPHLPPALKDRLIMIQGVYNAQVVALGSIVPSTHMTVITTL